MAKYVLLTEVKKEASLVEWWMDQTDNTDSFQIFNSFEEAKAEMRKAISFLAKKCDFFPLENRQYLPIEEYALYCGDDMEKLQDIINCSLNKPDYFCEDPELDIQDTDDADWYFAFVGNKDLILADYYGITLKMNIHNMADPEKTYFFNYCEVDEECRVINSISIRLFNDAEKSEKKNVEKELISYDVVTFGRYMQDRDGEEFSPLSWRVLDKRDGMALLVTENVIDHIQFSSTENNDWEKSDIKKWLNAEFADRAFNEREKALIKESVSGQKVFLLSLEEYNAYFSDAKDARAGYTDYSRQKISAHHSANIREPYAFWWLRSANDIGGWGEDGTVYVYHVCNNGTLNPYERAKYLDGVRPAIWVKWDGKE